MNQAYGETGEPLKEPLSSKDSMSGALHGSSHVWIWRQTKAGIEILIQRRAAIKKTWPNFWDISAAGHMEYGETPLAAARRETEEEIGITTTAEQFCLLFVHRQYLVARVGPRAIENEFQFVYTLNLNNERFVLQKEEVAETKWVKLDMLKQMISNGKIVPHGEVYFTELFFQLERMVES